MRRLVLVSLLAACAVPSVAQDSDASGGDRPARAERSERFERPARAERIESRARAMEAREQVREQAMEARSQARQQAMEARQQQRAMRIEQQQSADGVPQPGQRRPSAFGRQWPEGTIMPREREVRTIPNAGQAPVTTTPNGGTVTTRHRDRDGRRWSGDQRRWDRHGWRRDHRYDWRRWRDRNRSTFRIGLYIDPFGWGYRRWGVGSYLYPGYYRSSYWLNDPWMYRLPPAYPPYRWVRYHNDAVLVDTWSGEVVDIIYNFFW
mgnify:CR=1 FL=1